MNTDNLRSKIKGAVMVPGDAAYEDARRVWNAMIDRRPALIVCCADDTDVAPAITFARQNDLDISFRRGGHHSAGHSVCEGGLVIDFSGMKKVQMDAGARRAYVQPRATLGDFDWAVQEHGLEVGRYQLDNCNSPSDAGGGFGWLTREYGMTVEQSGRRQRSKGGRENAPREWEG
jgi:FAD/FMN-containing dehydrogenase